MAKATTTEVQVHEQVKSLRSFLEAPSVRTQIERALPRHLTADRVLRQAMTLAQMNPGLLKCTQTSILRGIIQASEMGLELSGPLGHAYLVPRWNDKVKATEACFQVGYKGLVSLAFRSGQLRSFPTRVVRERDLFRVEEGSENKLVHVRANGDRGPVVAYYAIVFLKNGGHDFEAMSRAEVCEHRDKYAQGSDSPRSAWQTSFDGMALKTCVRKMGPRLPLSVDFQTAIAIDQENEIQYLPAPAEVAQLSHADAIGAKLDEVASDPEPVAAEREREREPGEEG